MKMEEEDLLCSLLEEGRPPPPPPIPADRGRAFKIALRVRTSYVYGDIERYLHANQTEMYYLAL
jgi:hypothetical protein